MCDIAQNAHGFGNKYHSMLIIYIATVWGGPGGGGGGGGVSLQLGPTHNTTTAHAYQHWI